MRKIIHSLKLNNVTEPKPELGFLYHPFIQLGEFSLNFKDEIIRRDFAAICLGHQKIENITELEQINPAIDIQRSESPDFIN